MDTIVQKFDYSMIEKCLRDASLRFLRDNDGDFVVQFDYSDTIGGDININLVVNGAAHTVYSIRGTSDKRIQRNDWGRVIMTCNTWNKERRWPKAYLYIQNPSSDTTGIVVLEQNLDLEKGIHQVLFNDFTLTAIAGIIQFWEWAHQEQGL